MGPFSCRWVALLLLVLMCTRQELRAQFSGATVTGVVQDSSRAVLPAAKLRLINTQTGAENDAVTNRDGSFALPGILGGTYTLQVESGGFATTQLRGITLTDGDTKTLIIRMKVGSVAETVTVDASGLTMNTTSAAVEVTADRKLTENLPLNGRSFPDLILLAPGIVTQNPQAGGRGDSTVGEFSVNGQQPGSNSFFVDGVAANVGLGASNGGSRLASTGSIAGTTALGTTQSMVSVDALEEFRVLTSTYSAEYGRTSGGQFNFVTRAGKDGFHGSLYEYYRRDTLDAKDYFTTYSTFGFNQFDSGATLGGAFPWAHNSYRKGYIFGSYEGLYVAQPTPPLFQYGPAEELTRGPHYPGPLPSAATVLLPILDSFGVAGNEILDGRGLPTGLGFAQAQDLALPSHANAIGIRFDQVLNPRLSFFVRYADTPSFGQAEQLSSLSRNQVSSQTLTFGVTTQVSTGRNNEFRLGYARNHSTLHTDIEPNFPSTAIVDLNSLLGVPAGYGSVRSQVYLHADGAGDSAIQNDQTSSSLTQWNLRDIFALPLRNHLFKFGFDQRRLNSAVDPTALLVQANFFDRASMVHNQISHLVVSDSGPASPQIQQFSAFADDTWKVSNTVNFSVGMRWEVNPAPTGRNKQDAFTARGNPLLPTTLQLAPRGTVLWPTTWFNLAPRLGAAWVADNRSGRETVIRGGAGIFFDTSDEQALGAFHGLGFQSSRAFPNPQVPLNPALLDVPLSVDAPYTDAVVYRFPSHLQLPYSLQWNLGIERELGKYQSITASYVGASGRRLLREQRTDVRTANPEFGDVSYFPGSLTSNYQALQLKFQRTFSHGVEALASYTWAHSLDFGSTSPQFPLRYGSSDLDVRQNLEGGFTWTLPPGEGSRLSKTFLGRWVVDGRFMARTSFPVDLAGNFFFDTVTGTPYYSGVDLIPSQPLYYHSRSVAGGKGFNGGPTNNRPLFLPAFALPSGQDAGDAPRNLMRGFGLIQANFAGKRNFRVYKRLNLEVGAEVFNVLNHPNLGYIDPYLTDSSFGQSIRMLNQSFGLTGALYQEGGPRATQFHLRFSF